MTPFCGIEANTALQDSLSLRRGWPACTANPSDLVRPPRDAGCPLRFEAHAERVRPDVSGGFVVVEAVVRKVHADPRIVVPGTGHVDPAAWSPLIYNFRHHFGLGPELGHSYRTETPRPVRSEAPSSQVTATIPL
jgi:hypothetical protein